MPELVGGSSQPSGSDAGDQQAIRARVHSRLSGTKFCTTYNIDDLVQQTLENYYRYVKDNAEAIQNPTAYVLRVADNTCKRFLRSRDNEEKHTASDLPAPLPGEECVSLLDTLADEKDLPEEVLLGQEAKERIEQAINQLHQPLLRQIMQLLAKGADYQEIAEITGRAVTTVRKNAREARKQLKVLLYEREE
jgi:RNA polymerase sigma factor (sigma-70 family)